MKKEIILCDNCQEQTVDIYDEIGWITIEKPKLISISGGRNADGVGDHFRFIQISGDMHFCCTQCLLEFLYLSEGHFNSSSYKKLEDKLNTLDGNRRKIIEGIVNDIIIRGMEE